MDAGQEPIELKPSALNPAVLKPIVLKPMHEHDLPGVVRVETASYEFPWSEGSFRDCIKAGYSGLVALCGSSEEVVGYAIMLVAANEGQLLNLCVIPAARRRGIAGQLLERQLMVARELDTHKVFLEVRPSNAAAVKLYERHGFKRIAVRENYYKAAQGREDALVLALEL